MYYTEQECHLCSWPTTHFEEFDLGNGYWLLICDACLEKRSGPAREVTDQRQ